MWAGDRLGAGVACGWVAGVLPGRLGLCLPTGLVLDLDLLVLPAVERLEMLQFLPESVLQESLNLRN